jgi:hypothetical protein
VRDRIHHFLAAYREFASLVNSKRLVLAIVAAFVFIVVSDILIHGVWLLPDYKATASLWRTDPEMNARMPWMFAGQFLLASTFVVLWAMGFAGRGGIKSACVYGLLMGLFNQANTLINYVVSPMPPGLAAKWFVSALAQSVLLAVMTFFIYKPAQPPPK